MSARNQEAFKYFIDHQSEYVRGRGFAKKIAEKFNVSPHTVRLWIRKYDIQLNDRKDIIANILTKNPRQKTVQQIADELGICYTSVAKHIHTLGMENLVAPRGKWGRIPLSEIEGKTYEEVMKKFGIKSWSAMSHIAQRTGWDKYLNKGFGREALLFSKDDVREVAKKISKEEMVAKLQELKEQVNSKVSFTKDNFLTKLNYEKCKTSIALSMAIIALQNARR